MITDTKNILTLAASLSPGEVVYSVAYQHANKWLKANPTGEYLILSVHPQRPSLYRNQLTFKHPWYKPDHSTTKQETNK